MTQGGAAQAGPFRDGACVLCRVRPSTRKGEHVWPLWYLRSSLHRGGPYPWELSGRPIVRRGGEPLAPMQMARVKLPTCAQCNNTLERRFERAAAPLVTRLFSEPDLVVDNAADVELIALWLVKTWLLLSHPAIHYSEPLINELDIIRDRKALPQSCYQWLVNGGDAPDGLSLWVFKSAPDDEHAVRPIVPLPVVHADDVVVRFQAHEVTLHGLTIALVYHPGWPVHHPAERAGRALQLWPRPPRSIRLGDLTPATVDMAPLWSEGWRVVLRGGADLSDMPPLCATRDPLRFFLRMMGRHLTSVGR